MSGLEKNNKNLSKLESELKGLSNFDEFARDNLLDLDPFTQKMVLNSKDLSAFKIAIYNRESDLTPSAYLQKYWFVDRYFIEKEKLEEAKRAETRNKIKGVMKRAA